MARDIAQDTLNVGNALANVRIDQMILNLAKGIAWGQYELDKVGVDITRMMGVPGTVDIGGEKLSMLEAGFIPSFYHFVDTILELKMEVNIREEQSSKVATKDTTSGSSERSFNSEFSMKTKVEGGVNAGIYKASGSLEMGIKAGFSQKSTSAFSRSVDASHAQKFSQDLSASSLMRTKLVPVPAPELLLERIKILLEKLRKESEEGEAKSEQKALENLGEELFTLTPDANEFPNFDQNSLDSPSDELRDAVHKAFKGQTDHLLLKKFEISPKPADKDSNGNVIRKKWIVSDKAENKYILAMDSPAQNAEPGTDTTTDASATAGPQIVHVHSGGQTKTELFDLGEMFGVPE